MTCPSRPQLILPNQRPGAENAEGATSAVPPESGVFRTIHLALSVPLLIILGLSCAAQAPSQPGNDSAALGELQSQVRELKVMVQQLQQQTVDSRAEITRLREELEQSGQRRRCGHQR